MSTEHASITSFRGDLTRRGGTGDVVILPESAHTAALAAAALGCDVAQGYGIARPMPVDDFLHWLRHPRESADADSYAVA